jgi:pantoate--beta-alanine ligase
MRVIETRRELTEYLDVMRKNRFSVGLVPTMGAFHEGHLSLMRAARNDCDKVVVSVFVNPTQFAPDEDLGRYPRDVDADQEMAGSVDVDVLFLPPVEEMYPEGYATYVEVTGLSGLLCGRARTNHFRGVTTVVLKLLNLCRPDAAYLGQKDAQQAVIVSRMVEDLNLEVDIRILPIVREEDGLAMSSRNRYLGPEERRAASALFRSLETATRLYLDGERVSEVLIGEIRRLLAQEPLLDPEYVEIVHPRTLQPLGEIGGEALVALAVRAGRARLIDNTVLGGPEELMAGGPRP